ncbi:DUF6884 domain-containing protein [Aquibacillus kalidii]|uniref:DUF6884 domain-containing protein n=1 Tax=Aquibacillus kalidii TaxID=2762597 RepID=UPI0016445032|nr:DUF6884 domain-containing protein [Aquibacillus kalidii]
MKKELCIIPCGRKKIWDKYAHLGAVSAKEAYIGTFHRLCEQYATTYFDNWIILSAKHGFLLPVDTVSGNYDVTFNMKSDEIISINTLKNQVIYKNLNKYENIVVLTGKKYRPIVEASFHKDVTIQFPLLGSKGIGHMQRTLKESVLNKKPIHQMF